MPISNFDMFKQMNKQTKTTEVITNSMQTLKPLLKVRGQKANVAVLLNLENVLITSSNELN